MYALLAVLLAQVTLSDEGGASKSVNHIDCVGAGVVCSTSSTFGTITVAGGGGSVPAACSAGQATTSNGAALVCTSTLTASDLVCAGTCVADAEIAAVSGAKVSGTVAAATLAATATALAVNPAACGANLFVTDLAADGTLACTQPAFSNLSGSATDSQIPDNITVNLAAAAITLTDDPIDCGAGEYAQSISTAGDLSCNAVNFNQLSGAATDSQIPDNITIDLATAATTLAFGGGTCAEDFVVRGIDQNGSPLCGQVGTEMLVGTISNPQLANSYSGVGACGANTWASTLSANASPTCTQPAFSNLSGTVTMAQLGTTNTSGSAVAFLRGDGVWAQCPAKTLTSVIAARVNPFLPTCNAVRRFNCRTSKGLAQ